MAISISGNTGSTTATQPVVSQNKRASNETAHLANTASTDKVTLGAKTASETYADPRAAKVQNADDLKSMLEESNRQAQAIIDLILPLVQQQGLQLSKVVSGEQKLTVDQTTIDKAKAAVTDDGEFGVTQVAERILSFAKSVIGDDPSKLEAVRAAVEKGFRQAADALGGSLPDISEKTHTAIMAEFDRWQKDGIPSGDTVKLSVATTDNDSVAST